jgi:hypothetical protein
MDLCPIDRQHPETSETRIRAKSQHLAEQASDRVLVTLAEPRDRRVVGPLVRRDHAAGDMLHALALDHPRRALPTTVGVMHSATSPADHAPAAPRHPRDTARWLVLDAMVGSGRNVPGHLPVVDAVR